MFGVLVAMTLVGGPVPAPSQAYSPRPGESVLSMEIEGRGTLYIRLHVKEAPRTTSHIMRLARQGYYDGQRFFEVTRTPRPYLIRFGDPLSRDPKMLDSSEIGTKGTGARIPFENTGYAHERGAVGLARPREDKNGGDCQFYIMLSTFRFLDGEYTVFGKVVAGLDLLDRIEKGEVVVSVRVLGG